jgi:hypothetical protein
MVFAPFPLNTQTPTLQALLSCLCFDLQLKFPLYVLFLLHPSSSSMAQYNLPNLEGGGEVRILFWKLWWQVHLHNDHSAFRPVRDVHLTFRLLRPFYSVKFQYGDLWSPGRLTIGTSRPRDVLLLQRFIPGTFYYGDICPCGVLLLRHFVLVTFYNYEVSSPWRFTTGKNLVLQSFKCQEKPSATTPLNV